MIIYLIGSLRNPQVPVVAEQLREATHEVFDDWFSAGPEADDKWRDYERGRGRSYPEALSGYAAGHVFDFDRLHLERADAVVLMLPAGRSGHLELGWAIGRGKRGYILLEPEVASAKLTPEWIWLTGLYEGEGTLTRNGKKNAHGLQLSITMRDEDIIRKAHRIAGVGAVEGPYKRANPRWSDMWRWSTRKRADVLHVINGLWENLGIRRQAQISKVLKEAGLGAANLQSATRPHEFRFDVMYKFADGVYYDVESLVFELAHIPEEDDKYTAATAAYLADFAAGRNEQY